MNHSVQAPFTFRRLRLAVACAGAAMASACGGSDTAPLATLDGAQPLVIGHRGLPGLYPEETQPS